MMAIHDDPQAPVFQASAVPAVLTTGACLAAISSESQPPVAAFWGEKKKKRSLSPSHHDTSH